MGSDTILVIGYGNDLRGDDAAGRRAAVEVAAWGAPEIRVLTTHQLTPELADPLAAADRVIFLDAHPASESGGVRVRHVGHAASPTRFGHACDPQGLLDLTRTVFGRSPEAWWITIPAVDFAFGAPLSSLTARSIGDALAAVRRVIEPLHPGADAACCPDDTITVP